MGLPAHCRTKGLEGIGRWSWQRTSLHTLPHRQKWEAGAKPGLRDADLFYTESIDQVFLGFWQGLIQLWGVIKPEISFREKQIIYTLPENHFTLWHLGIEWLVSSEERVASCQLWWLSLKGSCNAYSLGLIFLCLKERAENSGSGIYLPALDSFLVVWSLSKSGQH